MFRTHNVRAHSVKKRSDGGGGRDAWAGRGEQGAWAWWRRMVAEKEACGEGAGEERGLGAGLRPGPDI